MVSKPTAAEIIQARVGERRWAELSSVSEKVLRYALILSVVSAIVLPVLTYLILAVLIP